MRGKHRLGVTGGEPPTGIGRPRLYQHGAALRAARRVERAGHLVELAAMVDRPDAVVMRIKTARAVVGDRVFGPAVPQRLDDGHELFAAAIAIGMADLAGAAEIARR